MKRVKETFDSNEIAHIWAHQSAPRGRVSGGNMSFEGTQFRSYSTVIANIIKYKGKSAFVLDEASFSVTTAKHMNQVRHAVRGNGKVFHVHCGRRGQTLEFTPQSLRGYYLAEFKQTGSPSKFAFKRAEDIVMRLNRLSSAIEVCEHFGLKCKALKATREKFCKEHVAAADALLHARKSKLEAASFRIEATRDARQAVKNAENIAKWKAGERVYLDHRLPTYLRREDNEIVTSKGARIPATDGERAFRFAIARRDKGWHRNGDQFAVGPYQLEAINEQGIVAGCHRIDWEEIERFAKLEGWV